MKLIYIKSTMEPKNYAALRSLLKQEQGEKIAPYVFGRKYSTPSRIFKARKDYLWNL